MPKNYFFFMKILLVPNFIRAFRKKYQKAKIRLPIFQFGTFFLELVLENEKYEPWFIKHRYQA